MPRGQFKVITDHLRRMQDAEASHYSADPWNDSPRRRGLSWDEWLIIAAIIGLFLFCAVLCLRPYFVSSNP